MVHVYTINWFKKVQNINYCSHAAQPTFNCHKRGGGRIMARTVVYSDAVSFRDIRGHLGTIPSIVTFYICVCRRRRLKQGHPSESQGIQIEPTCRRKRQKIKPLPMLTHPRVPSFWFFVYKLFLSWIWLKYCLLDLKQSINSHTLLYPALLMCWHCFLT